MQEILDPPSTVLKKYEHKTHGHLNCGVPTEVPNTEHGRSRHRTRDGPRGTRLRPRPRRSYVPCHRTPPGPVTTGPEPGVFVIKEHPETRTLPPLTEVLETLRRLWKKDKRTDNREPTENQYDKTDHSPTRCRTNITRGFISNEKETVYLSCV